MAVLPWGHSRSRTTSNEKRQKPALEWFSRSGGSEPSRQALTLLIREHTRSASAGSSSPKSRSSTAQSHYSKHSLSSQVTDSGEQVWEQSPSEQSRSDTPQLPAMRPTSPTYSLASALDRFGMSGSLKRKSSKMSMNSEVAVSPTAISPSRLGHSRLGFRRKEPPASPTKSEVKPPAISQPFAFQHITHSNQSHFNGLSKINESELALQFGAIQASQNPESGLRGIQAEQLHQQHHDRPCSPSPQEKETQLPMTPPRPAPPPKNSPPLMSQQIPPLEVRMSRSMENFSRPTPRSPTSPVSASPNRIRPLQLPQLTEVGQSQTGCTGKPLPHLPTLVHAVSTTDDTAQCMKSAPLPSPPLEQDSSASSQPQPSIKGSLRHMSTFPSARQQHYRFSSYVTTNRLMDIEEEKDRIPRYKSDDALTKYNNPSLSFTTVAPKSEDWEDAIEDAWDHADEQYTDGDDSSESTFTTTHPADGDSVGVIGHQRQQSRSNPSSPVMMRSPVRCRPISPAAVGNQNQARASVSSQMFGLGIDPSDDSSSSLTRMDPPSLGICIPEHSEQDGYQLPRTTYSAISKSSSQESIIFSIASSILGTQRSSNSSVTPSDLSRLSECEESVPAVTSAPSPLLAVDHPKAARPESACVPMSLLKGFAPPSSENTVTVSDNDEDSTDASEAQDDLAPLVSEMPIDTKMPNVSAPTSPQRSLPLVKGSPRKRSSTQSSQRSGRGSYSLFPIQPAQTTTSSPTT